MTEKEGLVVWLCERVKNEILGSLEDLMIMVGSREDFNALIVSFDAIISIMRNDEFTIKFFKDKMNGEPMIRRGDD